MHPHRSSALGYATPPAPPALAAAGARCAAAAGAYAPSGADILGDARVAKRVAARTANREKSCASELYIFPPLTTESPTCHTTVLSNI